MSSGSGSTTDDFVDSQECADQDQGTGVVCSQFAPYED